MSLLVASFMRKMMLGLLTKWDHSNFVEGE
jgi:hypothetical protein